jgi:hypothetical protein
LWDLEVLDLSRNNLVGEVTTMTNSPCSLVSLHLSNNNFTGSFSAVLRNFRNLTIVDLGNNFFFWNNSSVDSREQPFVEDSMAMIKYAPWKYSLAAFTTLISPPT